ncbi:MAG: helix-turn-helix transcriptional regulator [Nitrospirae bacterium]|nr:helix-turn-helix transcriptional regulator [Nitrospirota bacterium]
MTPARLPEFGSQIRALRQKRGLTQESLASLAGVEPQYISHIETGRRRAPSDKVIRRLAEALRCDAGELVTIAIWARMPREAKRGIINLLWGSLNPADILLPPPEAKLKDTK